MRLIWICPQKRMRLAKKKRKRGTYPTGPGRVRSAATSVPRMYVFGILYITKGSSFGRFSKTLGMTSEARDSRTGNTDFSIARILANDPPVTDVDVARKRREFPGRESSRWRTEAGGERTSGPQDLGEQRDTSGESCRDDDKDAARRTDLTWLQYTRYRPPRLPRKSLAERRVKRRAGDHPRIPFSSSQLQVLEDRYQRGAYLSRNDVVEMSATLRLPQSKIKIWFQNRRARQRRESLNSMTTRRRG
ncbi:PREDICTED: LOW QUALITY PROTEIN: homeobox protein engrailed-2b [Vollenhovia emeryi]|uniref:LOW QUALITY PROTEIN: homeobox protein engrailed-2b n=1 Tax=Vollenhovia emeryi TaxID=411798 RepID=UPI0005F380AE|nr:PREDICTED: LOW QUALITY PROTEIN: homeobox protein engrailed-2b [Vollenhovia emeryi]